MILTEVSKWLYCFINKSGRSGGRSQRRAANQGCFTVTAWTNQLTRSMRSLRFFSICWGGRRLIRSRAQSSCFSVWNKESQSDGEDDGALWTREVILKVCCEFIHCRLFLFFIFWRQYGQIFVAQNKHCTEVDWFNLKLLWLLQFSYSCYCVIFSSLRSYFCLYFKFDTFSIAAHKN